MPHLKILKRCSGQARAHFDKFIGLRTTPSSRGLGHRPFTAVTGVRIPVGSPFHFFRGLQFVHIERAPSGLASGTCPVPRTRQSLQPREPPVLLNL